MSETLTNTSLLNSILNIAKIKSDSITKILGPKVYTKEYILNLLAKDKKDRTRHEIRALSNHLSEKYEFFKKLKNNADYDKLMKLCTVLNLEEFLPNENIINFGDEGDKFYIVFEGLVGVYIPKYNETIMTLKEYLSYMHNVINIEKNVSKYERIKEKNAHHYSIDIDKLLTIKIDEFHGKKSYPFIIEEFDKVNQLEDGSGFGEIALIKRAKRNATIKSIQHTKLITINKNDYNKCLREVEEKRLIKQLEDFRNTYSIFQYWTINHLISLFNCFTKITYTYGDYLFKQNEDSDSIYIILNGKFSVYSLINFSWAEKFFSYIKDSKLNLINRLSNDKILNEQHLMSLYRDAVKQTTPAPFIIDATRKVKIISSIEDKENLVEQLKNESTLYEIQNMVKVDLRTFEYCDIVGIEDAMEMKKRITFIKCVSTAAEVYKIKVIDFLRIINLKADEKNKTIINKVIYEKKSIICNKIRNHIMKMSNQTNMNRDTKFNSIVFNNSQVKRPITSSSNHHKGFELKTNTTCKKFDWPVKTKNTSLGTTEVNNLQFFDEHDKQNLLTGNINKTSDNSEVNALNINHQSSTTSIEGILDTKIPLQKRPCSIRNKIIGYPIFSKDKTSNFVNLYCQGQSKSRCLMKNKDQKTITTDLTLNESTKNNITLPITQQNKTIIPYLSQTANISLNNSYIKNKQKLIKNESKGNITFEILKKKIFKETGKAIQQSKLKIFNEQYDRQDLKLLNIKSIFHKELIRPITPGLTNIWSIENTKQDSNSKKYIPRLKSYNKKMVKKKLIF